MSKSDRANEAPVEFRCYLELADWLKDQATGPMTQNPEHAETCDMLSQSADALLFIGRAIESVQQITVRTVPVDSCGPWLDDEAGLTQVLAGDAEVILAAQQIYRMAR